MKVYAVARGRQTGIYHTWNECKKQIDRFANAQFKKFDSVAEATNYLAQHGVDSAPPSVGSTDADADRPPPTSRTTDATDIRTFFHKTIVSPEKYNNTITPTLPAPHPHTDTHQPNNGSTRVHYVYTDGACKHNGRPNACAGAGVHFGKDDERNISVRVEGKQSNNTAEVVAILKACEVLAEHLDEHPEDRWVIVTDSQYALRYATTLGEKHARESWCQPIPNKQLVQHLYQTVSSEPRITLLKVAAHTNNDDPHSLGNEEADRLANRAIGETSCPYTRTYIKVAYARKDEAKKLGAKWDKRKKQWFTSGTNPDRDALLGMFGTVS
jgi:ribonuclease HI